jgi:hypothetical protein
MVARISAQEQMDELRVGMEIYKSHGIAKAEPHFLAATKGPDRELSNFSASAASDGFAGVGDYAAGRQYAEIAKGFADDTEVLGGKTKAEAVEDEARLSGLFAWTPKDKSPVMAAQQPTQRPLSESEEARTKGFPLNEMTIHGVAHGTAAISARKLTEHQETYDALGVTDSVEAELTGTLIRDQRGTFGVRDETTGSVYAVDFSFGREWALEEATKHVGKLVHVKGRTVLDAEGRTMTVSTFLGSNHRFTTAQARAGIRVTDPHVAVAMQVARAGRWIPTPGRNALA